MARKKLPDAFDVFVNAWGYQSTSTLLDQRVERNVFAAPSIVNEALSLELYLKCIHILRRRRPRKFGHDVCKLFSNLSKSDRRSLREYYDQLLAQYPLALKILRDGVLIDIESVLQRANGIFESMRYWHELPQFPKDSNGRSTSAGTSVLINACIQFLLEVRPDWQQRFESFARTGHERLSFHYHALPDHMGDVVR